ncbi:MAG: hypothetical protein NC541_15965 [bacterium]|nr:hypothetical protein [bacterium]
MTVSGAIIEWLKGFEPDEYWRMKRIDTDIQSSVSMTYALVKEPVQTVKSYLSGRKEYTDHYTIMARLPGNADRERMENNEFGEALEAFVREKNSREDYPVIPGAVVKGVRVTTPFYMGRTEENDSIYQMTIAIKYEGRN